MCVLACCNFLFFKVALLPSCLCVIVRVSVRKCFMCIRTQSCVSPVCVCVCVVLEEDVTITGLHSWGLGAGVVRILGLL